MDEGRQAMKDLGWRFYETSKRKYARYERLIYPNGNRRAIYRYHLFIRQKKDGWRLTWCREVRRDDNGFWGQTLQNKDSAPYPSHVAAAVHVTLIEDQFK